MPSDSTTLRLFPWHATWLNEKTTSLARLAVERVAVDLYVLGYTDHANRLIDTLNAYLPAYNLDLEEGLGLPALYHAWQTTGNLPSSLVESNYMILEVRKAHERSYALDLVKQMKKKPEKAWPAESPIDIAVMHLYEQTGEGYPARRVTIGGVVKLCLQENEPDRAKEIVRQKVPDIFRKLQKKLETETGQWVKLRSWLDGHLGLAEAPEIWNILREMRIGRELEIDEDALSAYVDEGRKLIEERFTHGVPARYPDKTIPDLVTMLNSAAIQTRKLQRQNDELNPDLSEEEEYTEVPDTFLNPPATQQQMSDIETRLHTSPLSANTSPDGSTSNSSRPILPESDTHLPSDYTSFLLATNGLNHTDDEKSPGIYCSVGEVGAPNLDNIRSIWTDLFPSNSISRSQEIPKIPIPEDISAIRIGGDETLGMGPLVLIPPSTILPLLQQFESIYTSPTTTPRQASILARAALDVYGSLSNILSLTWMCVRFNMEYGGVYIYNSFREYLAGMVSVQESEVRDYGADLEMRRNGELVGDVVVRKGKRRKTCDDDESD